MLCEPAPPAVNQSAAGPFQIRVLLPSFPVSVPKDLVVADRMRRGQQTRNPRPVVRPFCDLALLSRNCALGIAAYRQTFRQAVLLLLAELSRIIFPEPKPQIVSASCGDSMHIAVLTLM